MTAIIGIDAGILFVPVSTVNDATKGGIATATVNDGGSGYDVDDEVLVSGGTPDIQARLKITADTTGAVTDFIVMDGYEGSGYSTGTEVATTAATGSGDGLFTIDITAINPLVLPTWSTDTLVWNTTINSEDTAPNEYSWESFSERNEFSISISVDIAEHKVFVADPNNAWVGKARLFMDWSGSMSGYLDTASDTIFSEMKAGQDIWVLFLNSKSNDAPTDDGFPTQYWLGKVILGSVDISTPTEDYVTLDVDFEGSGELYRSQLPY